MAQFFNKGCQKIHKNCLVVLKLGNEFITILVRKDIDVNEHERQSNFILTNFINLK